MGNLIDSPSYTPNQIYEISQTDLVEGAAVGASNGGLGIDNVPHQQLANRTAWLYGQVSNLNAQIASIYINRLVTSSYSAVALPSLGGAIFVGTNTNIVYELSLTMPTSSPTGAFRLYARGAIIGTIQSGIGTPPWVGLLRIGLVENKSGKDILYGTGGVLVTGSTQDGFCIQGGDYSPTYYSNGEIATVTLTLILSGLITNVTGTTALISLTSVTA